MEFVTSTKGLEYKDSFNSIAAVRTPVIEVAKTCRKNGRTWISRKANSLDTRWNIQYMEIKAQ
jgi:hypothetical protein